MTDSAGYAEPITVEATVLPTVEKPVSDKHKVAGGIVYLLVGILWYTVIRVFILGIFAIPFALLPKVPATAATWLLFFQPIGLGVGAYVTLHTNRRNRAFHTMLAVAVFLSAVIGHITWGVGNPYVYRAVDGLDITAWVFQAIGILIGAALGWRKTKSHDIRIPKMLLPPKVRELLAGKEAQPAADEPITV